MKRAMVLGLSCLALFLGCYRSLSGEVIAKVTKRYPNGKMAEQTVYSRGKSMAAIIYADDEKGYQTKVVGNIPDGVVKFLNDKGKVFMEARFEHNQKNGKMIVFNEKGRRLLEQNMKDNLPDGEYLVFWEDNGAVAMRKNFKKGILDGKFIYYSDNGKVTATEVYKDGKLVEKNIIK